VNQQETGLKRRALISAAVLVGFAPWARATTEISGVPLNDEITFDNRKLMLHGDFMDHFNSTDKAQSGILMGVHWAGLPERLWG
jgi:hypothetical protein